MAVSHKLDPFDLAAGLSQQETAMRQAFNMPMYREAQRGCHGRTDIRGERLISEAHALEYASYLEREIERIKREHYEQMHLDKVSVNLAAAIEKDKLAMRMINGPAIPSNKKLLLC